MNICLYGGTFDPPHNGHLEIAGQCRRQFNIDRVYFIPAFLAPHKTDVTITAVSHRLAMLKSALQPYSGFNISEIEIKRQGISYSIDTILAMKHEFRLNRKEIFFLIGTDSLKEFDTWREPQRILNECQVIVAGRPGYSTDSIPEKYRKKVLVLSNPLMDISSTDIRQKIRLKQPVDDLLPRQVLDYIARNKLYHI